MQILHIRLAIRNGTNCRHALIVVKLIRFVSKIQMGTGNSHSSPSNIA